MPALFRNTITSLSNNFSSKHFDLVHKRIRLSIIHIVWYLIINERLELLLHNEVRFLWDLRS
ncbi:hypothetical protein GCM10007384_29320 [Aquimarina muelleri]|uniref:Uncharacterized protein n=1 Tax=Aquimarina muelleri TaxID=279356 RepID=A0A918JX48_9FLAO|nr:hypothetical protein GCM10007384_29320 [Aquimarina muelleri]